MRNRFSVWILGTMFTVGLVHPQSPGLGVGGGAGDLSRERVWTSSAGTQMKGTFLEYDAASKQAEFEFEVSSSLGERKVKRKVTVTSLSLEDQAYLRQLIRTIKQKEKDERAQQKAKQAEDLDTQLNKLRQVSPRLVKICEPDQAGKLDYQPKNLMAAGYIALSNWKSAADRRLIPRYPQIGFDDHFSASIGPFLGWWDEIGAVRNPKHGNAAEVRSWLERKLGVRYEMTEFFQDCGKPVKAVGILRDGPVSIEAVAKVTQGIDVSVLRILLLDKDDRVKHVRRCPLLVADERGQLNFLWGKRDDEVKVYECRMVPATKDLEKKSIRWQLTGFPKGTDEDIDRGKYRYMMDDQALSVISPIF